MKKLTYLCFIVFCATTSYGPPFSTENTQEASSYGVQRVRIDFTTPHGYVRHLLLGFISDNSATDSVDYGYDALVGDTFPDDLNWMIEDERYVIQGVGAFNDTKQYPLGMFISNSGDISISLDTLENFETTIDVFLYDALHNCYTLLNEIDFEDTVSEGTYLDRYYIAFKNDTEGSVENSSGTQLSISDNNKEETTISYLSQTKDVYVKSNATILKLEMYNLLGKRIINQENLNTNTIRLATTFTNENYGVVRIHTDQGIIHKKLLLK